MLEVRNLAQVNDGLDKWLESCEQLANDAFRGFAIRTFKYILDGTPQWSGNLAATWRMTVGQPAVGYSDSVFKGVDLGGIASDPEPFNRHAPNTAALHYAKDIAKSSAALIRLGAPVYITNTAPYAWEVEDNRDSKGRSFIRLVNLPVEMVHAAENKFSAFKKLSEVEALALAKEAL